MENMDTLTPPEKEALAGSVARGEATKVEQGLRLRHMRSEYNISRQLLSEVSGVSKTTLLRIENGQRSFSVYSLTHLLLGARKIVQTLYPRRTAGVNKIAWDLIEAVAADEEIQREKRRARQR
jgi:transcriptional regulator with XRE-family HTH domain